MADYCGLCSITRELLLVEMTRAEEATSTVLLLGAGKLVIEELIIGVKSIQLGHN